MATQLENDLVTQIGDPRMFGVFMLNDHYTTWDFCIRVISSVFHKNVQEADAITYEIHTKGKGLCGVYVYEIAETKASVVKQRARDEGFPMRCSIEEVS